MNVNENLVYFIATFEGHITRLVAYSLPVLVLFLTLVISQLLYIKEYITRVIFVSPKIQYFYDQGNRSHNGGITYVITK